MPSALYVRSMGFIGQFVPQKLMPLWKHPAVSFILRIRTMLVRINDQNLVPSKMRTNNLFLDHHTGPQTVFFWSPVFKWGLVMAGLGDLQRPADQISIPQTSALTATGCIWARYSLVIIPKNWALFSVNVFVALTGMYSLQRGIRYQMSQKNSRSLEA